MSDGTGGTLETTANAASHRLPGMPSGGRRLRWLFAAIAVALFSFTVYIAGFGWLDFMIIRGVHTLLVLFAVFMLFPSPLRGRYPLIETLSNLVFALLGAGSVLWFVLHFERLSILHRIEALDLVFGVVAIVVAIEAARRAVGWVVASLGVIAILYGRYGEHLPGPLWHRGFDWPHIIEFIAVGDYGLFGTPIGIVATVVTLFLYIGALLQASGALSRFMDFAFAVSGGTAGGPGKVAVVGSSLFGMVSGSTVANIATSGTVTIPLMRRLGFQPHFAAAIEATASSGGQLVPPVLGATAFLLADYAGVSYWYVVKSAILPAFLFYALLLALIDLRARRLGLSGLPHDQLPPLGKSALRLLPYLGPIAVLALLLARGYSAQFSALLALLALVATLVVLPSHRLTLSRFLEAMEQTLRQVATVSTACLVAGIIIAMLFMSGLSIRLTDLVATYSGGSLFLALLITMAVTVVLGMGVVTVGAYLLVATLTVPALVDMGADAFPAHMFVFYFSVFSAITPPVMVGIFTASAIAGSSPWRSGAAAIKLALIGFVLPFIWVFYPSLLGIGSTVQIIMIALTSLLGVLSLAVALEGYCFGQIGALRRVLAAVGAFLLIAPDMRWSLAGLAVVIMILGVPTIQALRDWRTPVSVDAEMK